MIFLILMAVMSTGSAEVIAVSSIVIYDVYQAYICPFKPNLKDGQCILCSKYLRKQKGDEDAELCDCTSTAKCEACIVRLLESINKKTYFVCFSARYYNPGEEYKFSEASLHL